MKAKETENGHIRVITKRLESGKRLAFILVVFAVAMAVVVGAIFKYQILDPDGFKELAADQYTVETTITARRGNIYDRNMNVIATSTTVERVFISPHDIKDEQEAVDISRALSEILEVDYDTIYAKTQKKNRRDETIKNYVEKEKTDEVRKFIKQYSADRGYTLKSIYFAETTKRYYPYGNLAAQVIGFTGTDGDGLLGIELEYNNYLKGESGKIVTSRNGVGDSMPTEYESYIDPTDGAQVISTLDMTIQGILEKYLKETYTDSKAANRVCGAVMNVKTGALYGMAVIPDFDLNDPYTLDTDSLAALEMYAEEELNEELVNKKKTELLYRMWSNKMISEIYEPGSTFKVMTATMALEEKVVSRTTPYFCSGSLVVAGQKINCHNTNGHKAVTFEKGLQVSCNPVFMLTAAKVGAKRFCYYFDGYGYTGKTGIDLPGEASPLYINSDKMHDVELAVYSFGQTFKISPIQQLRAISSVANGGYLVKPHIVDKVISPDGTVIYQSDTSPERQIISTETCKLVAEMLEGGVIDGSAKNAYVSGYRIAAKTGTSQKQDKYDENGERPYRIGSTVAFGPLEDPEIAIIILVDEPMTASKFGSVVAAPYVSKSLSEIFPYLGIEPNYSEDEKMISVKNYVGLTPDEAKAKIDVGIKVVVRGTGDKIISQIPHASSKLYQNGTIVLYTEGSDEESDSVTVPNLIGKTASEVNKALTNAGLNLNVEGSYLEGTAVVISQSVPYGTKVSRGSIITVEFRYYDVGDGFN